jgi:hypothetical protein
MIFRMVASSSLIGSGSMENRTGGISNGRHRGVTVGGAVRDEGPLAGGGAARGDRRPVCDDGPRRRGSP